jgi:dTDP-glucose 4,6-dehydratase
MHRLLVTGGAGFIGTNFVNYQVEKYPENLIIILDALTYAGNMSNLTNALKHKNVLFFKGNICDTPLVLKLLEEYKVDTIVNFAAESHVDRSIENPELFIQTNIHGTFSLLKAAKESWLDSPRPHRFHQISTDEVYGSLNPDDPTFTEHSSFLPNSPYAASKASADCLVRSFHQTYGLNTTISHCSNNYGPYHFPEKLIPLCILNILHGHKIPIYGDGKNIRDWLYVTDHCEAIDAILQRGQSGERYNIGGSNEYTNIDLVRLICQLLEKRFCLEPELKMHFTDAPISKEISSESLIHHIRDRAGHDRRYAINPVKIERECGFRAQETFVTGIQKTLDWYLKNESWWRPLCNVDTALA